jgi:hypothetical protein
MHHKYENKREGETNDIIMEKVMKQGCTLKLTLFNLDNNPLFIYLHSR